MPIGSVTNGIHVPTWDSEEADALWTKACGKKRWLGDGIRAEDIRRPDRRTVMANAQSWP